MFSLGVKANMETFEHYCLPFCNLVEPTLLIAKLQDIGYTVKETLTPVLVTLLSQQELQKAQDLCKYLHLVYRATQTTEMVGSKKNCKKFLIKAISFKNIFVYKKPIEHFFQETNLSSDKTVYSTIIWTVSSMFFYYVFKIFG